MMLNFMFNHFELSQFSFSDFVVFFSHVSSFYPLLCGFFINTEPPERVAIIYEDRMESLQGMIGPFDENTDLTLVCESTGGKSYITSVCVFFIMAKKERSRRSEKITK